MKAHRVHRERHRVRGAESLYVGSVDSLGHQVGYRWDFMDRKILGDETFLRQRRVQRDSWRAT